MEKESGNSFKPEKLLEPFKPENIIQALRKPDEIRLKSLRSLTNIAGGIGFGAAIEYLNTIGLEEIAAYEHELLMHATQGLKQIEGLKIYGDITHKTAVVSFNIRQLHPYDVGTLLDRMGIAVRTGQHCTQPVMDFYGIPGTVRASFAFYNTKEEIDIMIKGVQRAVNMLQ